MGLAIALSNNKCVLFFFLAGSLSLYYIDKIWLPLSFVGRKMSGSLAAQDDRPAKRVVVMISQSGNFHLHWGLASDSY